MAKGFAANFNVVVLPNGTWTKWTRCGSCGHMLRWTDYMSKVNPGHVLLEDCPACDAPGQHEVEIPDKDAKEAVDNAELLGNTEGGTPGSNGAIIT